MNLNKTLMITGLTTILTIESIFGYEPQKRIVNNNILKTKYEQAVEYVKQQKYDEAELLFAEIITAGPEKNDYYKKAIDWLNKKLFVHMTEHGLETLIGRLSAADVFINAANSTTNTAKKEEYLKIALDNLKAAEKIEEKISNESQRFNESNLYFQSNK